MTGIHIRGDGIAARCCEHILTRAGLRVSIQTDDRPRLPAIMLSDSALALIRDVFQNDGLFRDAFPIRRRGVAWDRDARPVVLPHSAVVVSERALLEGVRPASSIADALDSEWTIHAARPLPEGVADHRFGSRMATGIPVELRPDASPATCWIESVERGWLFLIPDSEASAWLLSVGGPAEVLLRESRVIAPKIQKSLPAAGEFAAYPRIASPLCGRVSGQVSERGWVACGTAAMAFDPICGDGTANAIREGILASAVILAAVRGGNVETLLEHYEARLTAGFQKHLAMCREFYRSGYGGQWWDAELEFVESGLDWCALQADGRAGFQYRLNGFELEAVR